MSSLEGRTVAASLPNPGLKPLPANLGSLGRARPPCGPLGRTADTKAGLLAAFITTLGKAQSPCGLPGQDPAVPSPGVGTVSRYPLPHPLNTLPSPHRTEPSNSSLFSLWLPVTLPEADYSFPGPSPDTPLPSGSTVF